MQHENKYIIKYGSQNDFFIIISIDEILCEFHIISISNIDQQKNGKKKSCKLHHHIQVSIFTYFNYIFV
jgi:hypothetical protein